MEECSESLYKITLNHICKNLTNYCELSRDKKLQFKNKHFKLNHVISEDILACLTEMGKINDTTLTLFTGPQCNLKKIKIKNISVSKKALSQLLQKNVINELSVNNVRFSQLISTASSTLVVDESINLNEIISGLNKESLIGLKSLNISRNISLFSHVLFSTSRLINLSRLNVSLTSFNDHSLDIVTQEIKHLEYLNMSSTKVSNFESLHRLKSTLKFLYAYNMRAAVNNDMIEVVCQLNKLQCLDVSCDLTTQIFEENLSFFDVNLMLDRLVEVKLNDLKYLDISGKLAIKTELLRQFLSCYSNLKFLGLALTGEFTILKDLNTLTITGESTESQVINSLKAYKTRHVYVQKSLIKLYKFLTASSRQTEPFIDSIELLKLITELMNQHGKLQSVQLAATSCIHYILKKGAALPSRLLTNIVNSVLNTMKNFPNNLIMLKNCLLILESNNYLFKNCRFDKFLCINVTLNNMLLYNNFNHDMILSRACSLCSQVIFNAEPSYRIKFRQLAEPHHAHILMTILKETLTDSSDGQLLNNVLDIICALSEGSEEWSTNFITQNCLNVMSMLHEGHEENKIPVFKIMSFLYNLSEIEQVRPILFGHPITKIADKCLHDSEMKISFLAAGFFANLLAYLPEDTFDWSNCGLISTDVHNFCQKLIDIIDYASEILVSQFCLNHFTLNPFMLLFKASDKEAVQTWALWAMFNVYMVKLKGVDGERNVLVNFLNKIKARRELTENVKYLCDFGMKLIEQN